MKIKDIGEFELIKRISKKIKTDSSVIKGIGDDAAVIEWGKGKVLLFASDMIIDGVHFRTGGSTPYGIGRKALGVNISDIAAMGGVPRHASISLGLPKGYGLKFVDGIYSGITSMARKFGVNITGGDTNLSDGLTIDVAMIGQAAKKEVVLRSGARPGDVVITTGKLGGSIKGRHLTFTPRVKESRFLVENFKINAMIDISDGLSSDMIRVCEASRVGVRIYESRIPVSKDAGSLKNALGDGEDFELLFTVSGDIFTEVLRRFKKNFKTPIAPIGEVTKKSCGMKMIGEDGKTVFLKESGFRHF